MAKFSGMYTPPFGDEWRSQIEFTWKQGRHGDAADKLFISSTCRVWTRVGETP